MTQMASTLSDVARVAGVSKATVSRVVNRSPRVTPEVAQVVLQAIEKTGYRPSSRRPVAITRPKRGLRTGNLLLLGLGYAVGDIESMIGGYPNLFQGVEHGARENGLKLVFASMRSDDELPAALNPHEVDGVLCFGPFVDISPVVQSRISELPAVGLLRGFDEIRARLDRVVFDNSVVGGMAAEYLHSRGGKKVAFFNINPEHPALLRRLNDFSATGAALGMEVVPVVARRHPEDFREEVAVYRELASQIADRDNGFTGVFVAGDSQVPQLYQALESMGVMPVRDIDMISCDNVGFFLDRLRPRPATIDINFDMVGYCGVQQLLWRIENQHIRNRVTLTVEPVLVPAVME